VRPDWRLRFVISRGCQRAQRQIASGSRSAALLIEHRLFSFTSTNWRGEPLRDCGTIVQLIAKTTTATGLKLNCRLGRRRYPAGRKVTDKESATVRLYPDRFHGDWNYEIRPHGYT
jgi:Rhodopirellula transposase DDE domain